MLNQGKMANAVYEIVKASELKYGDRIIYGGEIRDVVAYHQGGGAGSLDFGEYGVLEIKETLSERAKGHIFKNPRPWVYINLPVIRIVSFNGDAE